MTLSQYEAESVVWKKIESYLDERIAIMREKNDGFMEENNRNLLIGKIQMAKEIKGLATPAPQISSD